ncbi:MAG: hypothetical protein KGI51_16075, partial [Rhodospirillales bacterium]|nr:hypothetical protein [Rhodospirillales bacterium]
LRAALAREALSWLPEAPPRPGRAALPAILAARPARQALTRWAAGREAAEFRLGARLAMLAAWTIG